MNNAEERILYIYIYILEAIFREFRERPLERDSLKMRSTLVLFLLFLFFFFSFTHKKSILEGNPLKFIPVQFVSARNSSEKNVEEGAKIRLDTEREKKRSRRDGGFPSAAGIRIGGQRSEASGRRCELRGRCARLRARKISHPSSNALTHTHARARTRVVQSRS